MFNVRKKEARELWNLINIYFFAVFSDMEMEQQNLENLLCGQRW